MLNDKKQRIAIAIAVPLLLIIADQILKIYIKTHYALGGGVNVLGFDWFRIHFVENEGMAFGMKIGSKLLLTLFRLIACSFIVYYLTSIIKQNYKRGYIACIALILAGAFGNIIDCVFYGEIFTASTPVQVAQFTSFGNGYDSWLYGKVVDMFYFPLFRFPEWMPLVGGNIFFGAIFNLADAAISVGIVVLLLFYRKTLSLSLHEDKKQKNGQ